MEMVGTILLAPTVSATGIKLHICTIVKPAFSISLTIVAPQRVHVPHVDVRITASILSSKSFLVKLSPKAFAFPVDVPVPVVDIK